MTKKLDLRSAEPRDKAHLTVGGTRYWGELERRSYADLLPEQRVEWNLLFDLCGFEMSLRTLLHPGRESAVGRVTKGRPNLSVYYELVLQGMIEKGLVEVKKWVQPTPIVGTLPRFSRV